MNQSNKLLKKIERIENIIDKVFYIIGQLGIIIIILMLLFVIIDVFGRYLFRRPLVGSTELVMLSNILLSFFALVWCTLEKNHVRVDVLTKYISLKFQEISEIFYYLIGVFFFSLICVQNIKLTLKTFNEGIETVVLGIPLYPIYFAIGLTCGCVAILMLITVLKSTLLRVKRWI